LRPYTRAVALVATCAISGALPGSAAFADLLHPNDKPWDAGDSFKFNAKPNKTRKSVSGITCLADGNQAAFVGMVKLSATGRVGLPPF